MIIYEFKVKAKPEQYQAIYEAIKTSQFIQNKCLRYWIDNKGVSKYDLNKYCKVLAKEFKFANELNSMARQSAAERAWSGISRFYDNCKKQVKGKKGYPDCFPSECYANVPRNAPWFKKHCRSVEYKTSGWKLSQNRKAITFSDKKNIGTLKLKGNYNLNYYQLSQIKRVRLVKRADGYYVQFAIQIDLKIEAQLTGKAVGLDVGIKYFLADSNGDTIENPQFYRQSEKQLNRANRQKSKKYKKSAKPQSNNYHKARNRYARKHLREGRCMQRPYRQRKEYAKRVAYCVIHSNDLVAYEDLNVKGMVRNQRLAKSISDVAWSTFRGWLEYFGTKYGKATVAVPTHYTSQNCSNCGEVVKKSLSVRTHICPHCGYEADRDVNAARNILQKALSTVGHTGTYAWGDTPSGLVGFDLSSHGESLSQESPSLNSRGVSK